MSTIKWAIGLILTLAWTGTAFANDFAQPFSSTLRGHNYEVHSVSFSHDGQLLASGSGDRRVIVWDTETKEALHTLLGHKTTVYATAFSPTQKGFLASGSSDGLIRLWDATSGEVLGELKGTQAGVLCLDFSPDGRRLAAGYIDGKIRVWDVEEQKLLHVANRVDSYILGVKYSPDGEFIAAASGGNWSVSLFEAKGMTKLQEFMGHTGPVWDVDFSRTSNELISVSSDGTIRYWEPKKRDENKVIYAHEYLVLSLVLTSDGEHFFTGSADNTIKMWDAKAGKLIKTIRGHSGRVRGLDLSPNEETLASAGWDFTVRLWDLR